MQNNLPERLHTTTNCPLNYRTVGEHPIVQGEGQQPSAGLANIIYLYPKSCQDTGTHCRPEEVLW